MNGALIVDKPRGVTSHDVVNRVRRLASLRKVGHLGTLDPLATGVLPLLLGRATRLAQFFSQAIKEYRATIQFGHSTATYDSEGAATSSPVQVNLSAAALEEASRAFRGRFLQTPPPISAKKVAGVPAYKLARKQLPIELKPVEVEVFELQLLAFEGSQADFLVRCSSGTYIRSIAHDLGQVLGCGAFVSSLRRTLSGDFLEEKAFTLEQLNELAQAGQLESAMIPPAQLLPNIPNALVDEVTAGNIRMGRDFQLSPFRPNPGTRYIKAVSAVGELVAIGEAKLPHLYHPMLVL